jgi:hypothetical protein
MIKHLIWNSIFRMLRKSTSQRGFRARCRAFIRPVVQELESRLALSPLTLTWAPENQSTDWYVAANWSANWDANNVQRAPNQTDDVNIPSDTDACFLTGDPQTGGFAYAKSITISGGNLAARAGC